MFQLELDRFRRVRLGLRPCLWLRVRLRLGLGVGSAGDVGAVPPKFWAGSERKLCCNVWAGSWNLKYYKTFFLPTVFELISKQHCRANADILRDSLGFRCLTKHFLFAFWWIGCKWPQKRRPGRALEEVILEWQQPDLGYSRFEVSLIIWYV